MPRVTGEDVFERETCWLAMDWQERAGQAKERRKPARQREGQRLVVGEGRGLDAAKGQKSRRCSQTGTPTPSLAGLLGRVDKRVWVGFQGGRKPLESPRGG